PHALSGCDGSVQLVTLWKGAACPGSASAPLPDMMFQKATLIVGSAADAEEAWPAIAAIAKAHVNTRRLNRLVMALSCWGRTNVKLLGARGCARPPSGQR